MMGAQEEGFALRTLETRNGKGGKEAPFLSVMLRFLPAMLCYYHHHSCLPVVSMYYSSG